jgi:benzoylformate decarboxylase
MFNCQALWTAAHERLAIVFLILNNGAYRILKQRVNAMRDYAARPVAMSPWTSTTRPSILPRSGVPWVCRPSAPRPWTRPAALAAALAAEGPTLIDVTIDPSFSPV